MKSTRPMLVLGTRPEAIKMAPVINECKRRENVDPIVCFTGQHREMVAQVAEYFEINADHDLDVMRPDQSLAGLTSRCLEKLDAVTTRCSPDCIVAQGDTTTVMTASMIAFYRQLPFVHVEAGLRTGDIQSPWPEEYNRRVAGIVAALHCAPTKIAADNLLREGVGKKFVHITGNTVIDALLWTIDRERARTSQWAAKYSFLTRPRMVLITGHRRENFGEGFAQICAAISDLAAAFPEVEFVYPVHLNPNVRKPVFELLGSQENVHLVEPAKYPEFVWLMDSSDVILTDSGGVQEEAPSLKKPVVVMRDRTERHEAVEAGGVLLAGTDRSEIVRATSALLSDSAAYARCQLDENPYGDGNSARRIVDLVSQQAWLALSSSAAA